MKSKLLPKRGAQVKGETVARRLMRAVWLMLACMQMAWAAPVVTLTAPANNASYASPASITISADASDASDSIAKVEFYGNGTFIGTATQVPYTVTWTSVAAGSYSITAKATNSAGTSTVSAVAAVNVTGGGSGGGQQAQVYYIQPDHLNTPRVITDGNSNVVWRWDNGEPFGSNVANENPGGQGPFSYNLRFPGQYYDKETNLHYNYYRDYDPATGRYIESDPIGLAGGINTYAYVDSNPLVFYDPTGLQIAVPVTPTPPAGGGSNGGVNGGGVPGYNPVTDMPTSIPPSRPGYTPIPASVCLAAPAICAIITAANKPPKDAYDPNGAKAPGQPGDAEGFCEPKKGPKWGKSPNGRGSGWIDSDGNVWVPTGWGSDAHGGPHWDVQRPDGSYENVYPGGKRR